MSLRPKTLAEYRANQCAALARKEKRRAKSVNLWPGKNPKGKRQATLPMKRLIKRGPIKAEIVHLLGLLDRKNSGPFCRLDVFCPTWPAGKHHGEVAYHIVPQQRGDAARFIPENVVWACAAGNFGEKMNRSLFRDKHIGRWGKDLVERLEAIARTTRKYSMADLLELREDLRKKLSSAKL